MSKVQNFGDLIVWQKARFLCCEVFILINQPLFAKDYELKKQLNASSGSIMDNIAEGHGRKGNKEFINHLMIANGSAMEAKSQLYRAFDRKYPNEEKFFELLDVINQISKMIHSIIRHLSETPLRGEKFKLREQQSNTSSRTNI